MIALIIQFVRHMETEMNIKKILQGSMDTNLSKHGIEECYKFVENNDFSDVETIYSSNLQRAKFLAELISEKTNIELVIDERLNEISLGEWEGLTWDEILVKFEDFLKIWVKDNVNIKSPGGESYSDLNDRINSFMTDLKEKDHKRVIVVSHGVLIKTLVCGLLDMDLKNRGRLVIDNGSITEVFLNNNKVKVNKINS